MRRVVAPRRVPPRLAVVGIAVAVTLIGLLAAVAIRNVTGTFSFTLLVLPVVITAWFGEVFGAVLATVLVAVLTPLALSPSFSWTVTTTDDIVRLVLQVIVAAIVGTVVGRQHRTAETLHAVVESASDGILVTDAEGTVLHLNPAAAALTGWTSTAAHGHGVAEVFPLIEEGSRQPIEAPVRYLLRDGPDGATSRAPLLLRRQDGAERALSARAATVRGDDGGIIGTVLLFTDETERRQREQALREARDRADEARREADRSNAEKNHFIARVSHELRTPLNALIGWTRMLREGQIAPNRVSHAVAAIDRSADLLKTLVEDLVDMSRMTTGSLQLDVSDIDIVPVVQEAVGLVTVAADAKDVAVNVVTESEHLFVKGDAARLRQVVWNLLGNAVKFSPPGSRVVLTLRRAGSDAQLVVTDRGQGIPADMLLRVFEPFVQAASDKSGEGLGVGLAIVRQLVEAHGGRVTATSDGAGAGATFNVSLPAVSTGEASRTGHSAST